MLLIVLSFSQILPDIFGLSTLNKCSVVVWNSGPKQEYQTRDNDDCDDAFHILSISSVFWLSSLKKNAEKTFFVFGTGFARPPP